MAPPYSRAISASSRSLSVLLRGSCLRSPSSRYFGFTVALALHEHPKHSVFSRNFSPCGASPFAWHVLTALLGVPSASLSRHLRKPCFRFQSQTDLSFGTQSLKITRRALQTWISAICLFHPSFVIFKTALIQFLLQEVQHFSNLNIKLTGNTDTVK